MGEIFSKFKPKDTVWSLYTSSQQTNKQRNVCFSVTSTILAGIIDPDHHEEEQLLLYWDISIAVTENGKYSNHGLRKA